MTKPHPLATPFVIGLSLIIAFVIVFFGRSLTSPVLADSLHVVSLYVDGEQRIITTDAPTVGEILKRSGIILGRGDLPEPSLGTKLPSGFFNINIYRSRPVIIIDGNQTYRVQTAHQSPRQIASDAGVKLYPEDQATLGQVTDFVNDGGLGNRMVISRADLVSVRVDGKTLNLRTRAKTVRQLLADQKLTIGAADTVSPSPDHGVVPGMSAVITRVSEAVVTTPQTLARSTRTVLDNSMVKGSTRVQSEGSDGQQSVTYRVHYRDGVEVSRETLSVTDHVDPSPRIIVQGTKVFFAGNIEYWRPYVTESAAARGVNPDLMLGIMRCESNGNANASNGTHFGLYQYDWPTWLSNGGTSDNVYDGPTQIRLTAAKLSRDGTAAWAASKSCWSKYL